MYETVMIPSRTLYIFRRYIFNDSEIKTFKFQNLPSESFGGGGKVMSIPMSFYSYIIVNLSTYTLTFIPPCLLTHTSHFLVSIHCLQVFLQPSHTHIYTHTYPHIHHYTHTHLYTHTDP